MIDALWIILYIQCGVMTKDIKGFTKKFVTKQIALNERVNEIFGYYFFMSL